MNYSPESVGSPSITLARKTPVAYTRTERRVFLLAFAILLQSVFLLTNTRIGVPTNAIFSSIVEVFPDQKRHLITYFICSLIFFLSTHMKNFWVGLLVKTEKHKWWHFLAPQVVSFGIFLFFTTVLMTSSFDPPVSLSKDLNFLWISLLFLSLIATSVFSLLLIAPVKYWIFFLRTEKFPIILALGFSFGARISGSVSVESWDFLREPALKVVFFLLNAFYHDVNMNVSTADIGTERFMVTIATACSGYEGIGLVTAFLVWYLFSFRSEFKFPNCIWLFPIGIALIWICNCFRIFLLIAIGTSVSPDIAMNGFHSQSGTIFFLAISMGLVLFARKVPFFAANDNTFNFSIKKEEALLIPFLVLLSATLLTLAFSDGFVWLYPVRVLAVGTALFCLKRYFLPLKLDLSIFPVLVGTLVFFIWIWLIVPDQEANIRFAETLFSGSKIVVAAWLVARVVGSVIFVPIAEELVFRGYLLNLFPERFINKNSERAVQWIPLVVSSLLFGALHSQWIAGTVAGILYYFAKQMRGKLSDAVIAHITTNLLLSVYVLLFQEWSYW